MNFNKLKDVLTLLLVGFGLVIITVLPAYAKIPSKWPSIVLFTVAIFGSLLTSYAVLLKKLTGIVFFFVLVAVHVAAWHAIYSRLGVPTAITLGIIAFFEYVVFSISLDFFWRRSTTNVRS